MLIRKYLENSSRKTGTKTKMFNYFWRNNLYTYALSKNMVLEQNNGEGEYIFGQIEVGSLFRIIEIRKAKEEQNKVLVIFATTCLTAYCNEFNQTKIVSLYRKNFLLHTTNQSAGMRILKYFSCLGTLKVLIIHSVSLI